MNPALRNWMDFGLVILAILALWQCAYWYAGDVTLASPLQTLATLREQLGRDQFWGHIQATAQALSLSVVIAMAGGLALGIVFGMARRPGIIAEPILASLYSLPKVTLYPVVLLIFGLGISAKVAYGAIHGIIPVILITMTAIRQLKPAYIRTAKVMGLSRWEIATTVVLPATMPELVAALRLGFSLSLLGVIIGEMFASKRGMGFLVMNAVEFNNVPLILSVIVCLFVFAVSVNGVLLWLGRRVSHR